jgi:hypothetical protein
MLEEVFKADPIGEIFKSNPHAVVLVHCRAGISRSVSTVIAYLMKRYKMSFGLARKLVVLKRPIIEPNSGFVRILNGEWTQYLIDSDRACALMRQQSQAVDFPCQEECFSPCALVRQHGVIFESDKEEVNHLTEDEIVDLIACVHQYKNTYPSISFDMLIETIKAERALMRAQGTLPTNVCEQIRAMGIVS